MKNKEPKTPNEFQIYTVGHVFNGSCSGIIPIIDKKGRGMPPCFTTPEEAQDFINKLDVPISKNVIALKVILHDE